MYILSTDKLSNRNLKIGETIYGKILDTKFNENSMVYFFDKYSNPEEDLAYGILKGSNEQFEKDGFDFNKRIVFSVCDIKNNEYVLNYEYIEYDLKEDIHPFMQNNIKEYNGLFYIEQPIGITVVGFCDNRQDIKIPNKINNKPVLAIGNIDIYGNHIPIINNYNTQRNISFENGIKIIDECAFLNQNIKNIRIPNTIQSIGKLAFFGTKVNTIDLSKTNIDSIEEGTFAASTIEFIKLPNQLYKIDNIAFYNSLLKTIEMPNYINTIGDNVFYNCNIEHIVGNCEIDQVGFNEISHIDGHNNLNIHSQKVKDYRDIKMKLIGYTKVDDVVEDIIAEKAFGSEYEEIAVEKFIYLLKDESDNKYEFIIEKYEDTDFDDDNISYENYIRSISANCFIVDDYDIEKHLNIVGLDEAIDNLRFCKDYDYEAIDIRRNDLEKITGIKINERYRFLFDDLVLSKPFDNEFKASKLLIDYILHDKYPDVVENNELCNEIDAEINKYKNFLNSGKNIENSIKKDEIR